MFLSTVSFPFSQRSSRMPRKAENLNNDVTRANKSKNISYIICIKFTLYIHVYFLFDLYHYSWNSSARQIDESDSIASRSPISSSTRRWRPVRGFSLRVVPRTCIVPRYDYQHCVWSHSSWEESSSPPPPRLISTRAWLLLPWLSGRPSAVIICTVCCGCCSWWISSAIGRLQSASPGIIPDVAW